MDYRVWTGLHSQATDLARAEPFELGPLHIDPPARRIGSGPRTEMVEPRVMRVLVALGEAPGRVLSRDDLIELCWDGQIVSDSAIARVVSMLRQVLADLAGDAVRIETITKVGFRLLADGEAPEAADSSGLIPPEGGGVAPGEPTPFWRRKWTRRAALGGLAVAGGATALSFYGWDFIPGRVPNPRAVALYMRGQQAFQAARPGQAREAVELYRQAVAIDPDYADAWAALALAYSLATCDCDDFYRSLRRSVPRLVDEAAGRALALDPENPMAHLAKTLPFFRYRRWLDLEPKLRRIADRFPKFPGGIGLLGMLLEDVGRFEETLALRDREIAIDPDMSLAWSAKAYALHCLGRDEQALHVLDEAATRFPGHPGVWQLRFLVLIGGKRYAEAAAFVRDPRGRSPTIPAPMIEEITAKADALASGTGKEAIYARYRAMPKVEIEEVPVRVPFIAELGFTDLAFEGLELYYFGGKTSHGQVIAPPGPYDPRETAMLFAPALVALRNDPRYASLLERTGLEDYWRKSETKPDFRKA